MGYGPERIVCMKHITVCTIKGANYNQWDELVSTSPQGTIFHSSDWLTTISESMNWPFVLLGVFIQDTLIGGCCFYEQSKRYLLKTATTNAPLTPYSGFLLGKSDTIHLTEQEVWETAAITQLSEKIKGLGYFRANIINNPAFTDIRPLLWSGWKPYIKYTYVLSLDSDVNASFSRNVDRNIKKAQKEEICVHKEYDCEVMWNLQVKTYEKQGLPVPFEKTHLCRLMDMIYRKQRGDMWIATTQDGIPVSGECIIWDDQGAYRWLAASDPEYLQTGSTYFLFSEILQNLQSTNHNKLFMMAANKPNLSTFASNFNPILTPYYGVYKPYSFFHKGLKKALCKGTI